MKLKNKNRNLLCCGLISGFLNGLFGSGGGIIAVMFLQKIISDEKKAHATATLMILIMSIVSIIFYAMYGHIEWKQGLMFIPGGLIGAIIGTKILKNIKTKNLKRLFGLILLISGMVMLFS